MNKLSVLSDCQNRNRNKKIKLCWSRSEIRELLRTRTLQFIQKHTQTHMIVGNPMCNPFNFFVAYTEQV